jgi:endonuclease G
MAVHDDTLLRRYLDRVSPGGLTGAVEALDETLAKPLEDWLEGAGPAATGLAKAPADSRLGAVARQGTEKLAVGGELDPRERAAIEAIIVPDKRPAFDIVDGEIVFPAAIRDGLRGGHHLWRHLVADRDIHARLLAAIPAIGRVELPDQSRIPYAGTGFVVGRGLLMTNRHVAEIFAAGLGERIRFRTGWRAALDLRRERGGGAGPLLWVRAVRMIHPYWDMALLEVEGLRAELVPLTLTIEDARDLAGRQIAVIGYPGHDPLRNDPVVQDDLFDRVFGVKRLQPGELNGGGRTQSFGRLVTAATHDCSTLGGNSGSAVIDLASGRVLAMHFGGRYLDTNFAVPTFELARDERVVDVGVRFGDAAPIPPAPDWTSAWHEIEDTMANDTAPPRGTRPHPPATAATGGRVTFELPLRISVELGDAAPRLATGRTETGTSEERLVEPYRDTNYRTRRGYDENFLGITVLMPTARDARVLARLHDGRGTELKYQNFSILMHAQRRLALVTAANLTREKRLREPEGEGGYSRRDLSGLSKNDQEKWFLDPRLDERFQLPDAFFTKDDGAFDKGHLVRREDVAWGRSFEVLRRANGDTYHATNCSPQVMQFNRSTLGDDNWGELEDLVLKESANERLCVFAGPVLSPDDEVFVGRGAGRSERLRARIPSRYWKVVVARTVDGFAAYGFMLEQDLSSMPLEFAVTENFRRLMVPLVEIEQATGVDFGDMVRESDAYGADEGRELARRGGLERVPVLADHVASLAERPTPNVGDDEAAETEEGRRGTEEGLEGVARSWRVARSLVALREQVNRLAPQRNDDSDGTIGDASHQGRESDHNPWVTDAEMGVVTALDITHDPHGGCDAWKLADALVAARDCRVKYIIWNRRIVNSSQIGTSPPWTWRSYCGANPHTRHVHISVRADKTAYDNDSPWPMPT